MLLRSVGVQLNGDRALGSALIAGVACGVFSGYAEAVKAMVHVARRVEPTARGTEAYGRKYARYRRTVAALQPCWSGFDGTGAQDRSTT